MRRLAAMVLWASLASVSSAETDAFNLGILGAEGLPIKKVDESLKLPRGARGIEITAVHETGPARDAGLEPRDLIVAVGPGFLTRKMDAVYQLIELLEGASSSKKEQTVQLIVVREGKLETLQVRLPSLGAHSSSCPVGCDRCEKQVEASLQYLASVQKADGSFPTDLGGVNGSVVVTCLAGLAMLASGSTPAEGPYAENIAKAAAYVAEACGKESDFGGERPTGGANWNQTNWAYGYSPLFLCEVYQHAPTPELAKKLEEMAQIIEKNQEASGGWAHGPGGPNALNYVELQIVGNFCLTSYGALRKAGFKVPQATIDRGVAYCLATSGGDGGIGYSDKPGQKGMGDPGRTAGALWAFSLLDLHKHPYYVRMSSYFKRTMEDLPNGHVSPVQHFTSAAFACMHLGAAHWKEFIALFRLEILAARRPDGTFSARPTAESRALHNNTDRTMGPCWTTASYALILQLPKRKLKILTPAK